MEFFFAAIIAFAAGFVDAIAGGGGLIQIPGLLWLYPQLPIVTLLGSNKLASTCGTFAASMHFLRTLKIKLSTILPLIISAFILSICGAWFATQIDNQILKPLVFILLIIVGLYAFFNKKLGLAIHTEKYSKQKTLVVGCIISGILGFYDGFLGPGTGSFLIFAFVSVLGFDFLKASAQAKFCNLASNIGAILLFATTHHIIYSLALVMACFNVIGNLCGARLAIKKGSQFVRIVFLVIVAVISIKLACEFLCR